jgi:hypothetical protein
MKPWEIFLLKFVQAAAPLAENLFIHNGRSIAIFNASDALFNGVVDTMTATPAAAPAPTPAVSSK